MFKRKKVDLNDLYGSIRHSDIIGRINGMVVYFAHAWIGGKPIDFLEVSSWFDGNVNKRMNRLNLFDSNYIGFSDETDDLSEEEIIELNKLMNSPFTTKTPMVLSFTALFDNAWDYGNFWYIWEIYRTIDKKYRYMYGINYSLIKGDL